MRLHRRRGRLRGMLISPTMWRRFLKPHAPCVRPHRTAWSRVLVYLHPAAMWSRVEPSASVENGCEHAPADQPREHGRRRPEAQLRPHLCFTGGIEHSGGPCPSEPATRSEPTRRCIEVMGRAAACRRPDQADPAGCSTGQAPWLDRFLRGASAPSKVGLRNPRLQGRDPRAIEVIGRQRLSLSGRARCLPGVESAIDNSYGTVIGLQSKATDECCPGLCVTGQCASESAYAQRKEWRPRAPRAATLMRAP